MFVNRSQYVSFNTNFRYDQKLKTLYIQAGAIASVALIIDEKGIWDFVQRQVSIMQSHAPALAEQAKTWKFIELWVDPVLFPPKIIMLVGDRDGSCRIFNPASDYKLVVTHSNYQAAQEWLLEDEYERVKGQLLAE